MAICKCCRCGRRVSSSSSSSSCESSGSDVDEAAASVFMNNTVHSYHSKTSQQSREDGGKNTKRNGFCWRAKEFVDVTTMHGLSHAFAAGNYCTKFFWVVILLCVLSLAVYQVQELLVNFVGSPTLTSIKVVYPDGLEYPELTICLMSKLNGTRLKEKYPSMSRTVAEFSTASFISAYGTALVDLTYFERKNLTPEGLQSDLQRQIGNRDVLEFFEDATFSCGTQFLNCWFENGDMFNCCDPDPKYDVGLRVKRFLLHSGPCFKFHFNSSTIQRLPGPVGGFGFSYWYPNNDIVNTVFNAYDEHGVHLYTSPSDAMLEKNPIAMPVGSHIHITLTSTKVMRLARDSMGRKVCFEKKLKYFDTYDYPSCQAECLIDNMLKLCNCTGLTTYAKLSRDKFCSPYDAFNCFINYSTNMTNLLTKCRVERCTEACEYWIYRPSITVGKVFNPALQQKMVEYWRLPNTSDPSQSLIMADVYFDDIMYTDIKQLPAVTIEGFISQIGGCMGLWTGASIITWIHLCYFCCTGWHTKQGDKSAAKKKKKKKKKHKHTEKIKMYNPYFHPPRSSRRRSIPPSILQGAENEYLSNNPEFQGAISPSGSISPSATYRTDPEVASLSQSRKERRLEKQRSRKLLENRMNAEMKFWLRK